MINHSYEATEHSLFELNPNGPGQLTRHKALHVQALRGWTSLKILERRQEFNSG